MTETRETLKGQNLSFTEIAKLVGQNWQVLSAEEKASYESQAALAKQEYNRELGEYKKTESYRDHLKYLADFRAKHGGPAAGNALAFLIGPHLDREA